MAVIEGGSGPTRPGRKPALDDRLTRCRDFTFFIARALGFSITDLSVVWNCSERTVRRGARRGKQLIETLSIDRDPYPEATPPKGRARRPSAREGD